MIEYLLKHHIITGLIWESGEVEHKGSRYQLWLNKIRRTHSQLVYTSLDGGVFRAYADRKHAEFEPLAIHVKNEFGDGFYFSKFDESETDVYFLIIDKQRVISGSDRIIKAFFFDVLLSEKEVNQFSHLQVVELSRSWYEGIANTCQQRYVIMKRKQKLFAIGVSIAALFLLVLVSVSLNYMLS